MKYIVVVAGVVPHEHEIRAAMFFGPFDTYDEAENWVDEQDAEIRYWIRELIKGDT